MRFDYNKRTSTKFKHDKLAKKKITVRKKLSVGLESLIEPSGFLINDSDQIDLSRPNKVMVPFD